MRLLIMSAAFLVFAMAAAVPTGPQVGQPVPEFSLQDQDGLAQTLRGNLGPKGALLVFIRSADW